MAPGTCPWRQARHRSGYGYEGGSLTGTGCPPTTPPTTTCTDIEAAGIAAENKGPLFRSAAGKTLTDRPIDPNDALRMIKRRAKAIGLSESMCCHILLVTGITAYRANRGTLEDVQEISNHASPNTTKLYDRTSDEITLDEVQRILIHQFPTASHSSHPVSGC